MSVYSSHGTIRQEDIFACNITRSAIARSLAREARQTEFLVTELIAHMQANILPIEDLWTQVQANGTLRAIARTTDAHVDAYTQFSGWVKGARLHLAHVQNARLNAAFGHRLQAERFRNSDRLTRLHFLSSVPA